MSFGRGCKQPSSSELRAVAPSPVCPIFAFSFFRNSVRRPSVSSATFQQRRRRYSVVVVVKSDKMNRRARVGSACTRRICLERVASFERRCRIESYYNELIVRK